MRYIITPEAVNLMRSWALECEWLDYEEIEELSADQIMLGIQRHYFGGLAQFMLDSDA